MPCSSFPPPTPHWVAIITEAGSRWYQPPQSYDAGSPLTVINYLEALRLGFQAGKVPFVPGAMISW
jgi:hypothetical protein